MTAPAIGNSVYRAVIDQDLDVAATVPPRSTVVPTETAIEPKQRDGHLQCIAENIVALRAG